MASDINLVFCSSTITMMHGPVNIRLSNILCTKLCRDGTKSSQKKKSVVLFVYALNVGSGAGGGRGGRYVYYVVYH